MIFLIVGSFAAGMLTILSPCIFPFLPVIVGGSVDEKSRRRPYVITASLAITIILVTLLFKSFAEVFDVSDDVLRDISVALLIIIGCTLIFPEVWDKIAYKLGFSAVSGKVIQGSSNKSGLISEIAIGASLGPAFASCSPVYAVILAQVLPASFIEGTIYLTAYAFGLGFIMLLVALLGDTIIRKLQWAVNPHGWFRRMVGVAFVAIAVMLFFDWDKTLATELLEYEWYLDFQERFLLFENDVANELRD